MVILSDCQPTYSTFLNSHSPPVKSKIEHFIPNPPTLPGKTLNSEQILFTDLEATLDDGLSIGSGTFVNPRLSLED